ncbi:hypothetical protein D3C71_2018040 [compost metagenome]
MTWERYCIGLPGVVIAIADNQLEVAKNGQRLGIDHYLGASANISEEDITQAVKKLLTSVSWLQEARELAMDIVDGNGVLRVVNYLV